VADHGTLAHAAWCKTQGWRFQQQDHVVVSSGTEPISSQTEVVSLHISSKAYVRHGIMRLQWYMACVCDGHGGDMIAKHCIARISEHMNTAIASLPNSSTEIFTQAALQSMEAAVGHLENEVRCVCCSNLFRRHFSYGCEGFCISMKTEPQPGRQYPGICALIRVLPSVNYTLLTRAAEHAGRRCASACAVLRILSP
jgi:hypothetical protein